MNAFFSFVPFMAIYQNILIH